VTRLSTLRGNEMIRGNPFCINLWLCTTADVMLHKRRECLDQLIEFQFINIRPSHWLTLGVNWDISRGYERVGEVSDAVSNFSVEVSTVGQRLHIYVSLYETMGVKIGGCG
jgi:hypothetical protein